MQIKDFFPVILALGLPLRVLAGSLYPMECGDMARESHNLNPSPIHNPLKVSWVSLPCFSLGYAVSNPIVLSDRVIQCYQYGVRCFDRTTGAHLWTWGCDQRTQIWSAPCYDGERNRVYVGCFNGDTLALDPSTGKVLWVYTHRAGSAQPWQYSSPLYAQGKLYIGNGGYGFLCLDPDSLTVVWQLDFSTYFGTSYHNSTCTPDFANGSLYLSTTCGDLFQLDPGTGAVLWHVKENLTHVNPTLLYGGYLYTLGNVSQLECRNATDGSLVWTADTHVLVGGTNGNLAICGDILIVPGDSWRVWGLNRLTGQQVWNTRLSGNFALNSPLVVCGKVFISACHGNYYGLDGQTGQVEWNFYHGIEYTFVGWAEADGQLFVGNKDGRLFCFVSVAPGDPATCACNLNATPQPGLPSPSPTPVLLFKPAFRGTPYFTPYKTRTPTVTLTPTVTRTPTWTFTATKTFTDTKTPTATWTGTSTWTFTETDSFTATATATSTATSTGTATNSFTATFTLTPTDTATHTPTRQATSMATVTSTVIWTKGQPVIYPNPITGPGDVHLRLGTLVGPADVKVQLFTTAFRKVSDLTYSQIQPGSDIAFAPVNAFGVPLSNGLYYVAVNYWSGPPGSGATYEHSVGKLLITR